jgi:hypothetical protein
MQNTVQSPNAAIVKNQSLTFICLASFGSIYSASDHFETDARCIKESDAAINNFIRIRSPASKQNHI